jgi:predicted RNA-binding Zn ribbon-like protein
MEGIELVNSGDHPALDFLNTRCRPWGQQLELLETGASFLEWQLSVGLIDDADRTTITRAFDAEALDAVAAEGRELREWLRGEIGPWAEDGPVPARAVERLNGLLARDASYLQLELVDGEAALVSHRRWDDPSQLLVPVAEAAAELFASGDRELVRLCDGPRCTLWFYDRTKSHRRRWCSQAVCGNRDKVRNHRARAREDALGR